MGQAFSDLFAEGGVGRLYQGTGRALLGWPGVAALPHDMPDELWVLILAWLPLRSPGFRAATDIESMGDAVTTHVMTDCVCACLQAAGTCRWLRSLLQTPAMRAARRRCSVATVAVIAVGGCVSDWPDCCAYPQQILHDLACSALVNGRWHRLPPLPSPVNQERRAAVVRGGLYVAGRWHGPEQECMDRRSRAGHTEPPEDPFFLFRFDLALQRWERIPDAMHVLTADRELQHPRARKVVRVGEKMFAVTTDRHAAALHVFDSAQANPEWAAAPLPESIESTRRWDSVLVGGRGVGWDSPAAVAVFDPASSSWEPFASLPAKRKTNRHADATGMLSVVEHTEGGAGGLFISSRGQAPTMLILATGAVVDYPPIPRGQGHVTDNDYLQHPLDSVTQEPHGCCSDSYEYEEDYLNELEEIGGVHDGRQFDSEDGARDATPEEWAADAFEWGEVADHMLVSVDWL